MRGRAGIRGHRGHRKLSPTEDLELAKPFLDSIATVSPPRVERPWIIEHSCRPLTAQKTDSFPTVALSESKVSLIGNRQNPKVFVQFGVNAR